MNTPTVLTQCLNAIDQVNSLDPQREDYQGQPVAKSLLYGQRMSQCLQQYVADANELLQIAVRAQHIERWKIARSDFDAGRSGYLLWRKAQGIHHGERCSAIMKQFGYSEADQNTVAQLLQKRGLKSNQDTQTLEDVACLVFLRHYFEDFRHQHSREKIIRILQKTWAKMSHSAQQAALQLPLTAAQAKLLTAALKGED